MKIFLLVFLLILASCSWTNDNNVDNNSWALNNNVNNTTWKSLSWTNTPNSSENEISNTDWNTNLAEGANIDVEFSKKIDSINNQIEDWKTDEALKTTLDLYESDKENVAVLNTLWNIYLNKRDPENAIKYLKEANKISDWKDWHVLFNLWVAYTSINQETAIKYLEEAKKILPDDKNLAKMLEEQKKN